MFKNDFFTLIIVLGLLILGGVFAYRNNVAIFPNFVAKTSPSPTLSPNAKTEELTIIASSFKFDPNVITVSKDDRIKITFKVADGPHNLTIPDYNIATKTMNAGQQQIVEFIATKSGSFQFFCSYGHHKEFGMMGKLIVK